MLFVPIRGRVLIPFCQDLLGMAVRLDPVVDLVNGTVGVDEVGHPAGAFVLPAHELLLC